MKNKETYEEYFNGKWYLKQYPEVAQAGYDPLEHFIGYGWRNGYISGKDFKIQKYLPRKSNLIVSDTSFTDYVRFIYDTFSVSTLVYPKEAQSLSSSFKEFEKGKKFKRVTIFASVLYGSVVQEYELYFLEKLREVSDIIIYIADSPILAEEFAKLSKYVDYASCKKHGEYDFGSYKYGIEYLKSVLNLEDIEELILCNNSCIGPIFPLVDLFETMQTKKVDFWGLSSSQAFSSHLQSYFLVFSNKVLCSKAFLSFFGNVKREISRGSVIFQYEVQLTPYLQKHGFTWDALVHGFTKDEALAKGIHTLDISMSLYLLIEKRVPFIKVAFFLKENRIQEGKDIIQIFEQNQELTLAALDYSKQFALYQNDWVCLQKVSLKNKKQLEHIYSIFCEQANAFIQSKAMQK